MGYGAHLVLASIHAWDSLLAAVRRSVSLPAEIAEKLDGIAAARHVSANRAIVDLLADAITAYEQRRAIFPELADRFQKSTDPAETERLRDELANMTFGH
jgi:metal-responsive CopG/Arc/MetJ family transcriptional regulator